MTTLSIHVKVCIWVLGFHDKTFEVLVASLSYALYIKVVLMCSYLRWFVALLSYMLRMKKCSMTFSLESENRFYM